MLRVWKRALFLAALLVGLLALPAMAAPVEFLTPSGGETFVGGSEQKVVYRTENNTGIVRLYYRFSAGGDWIKVSEGKAGAIDYPWMVPAAATDISSAQLKAVWVESDWPSAKVLGETISKQFSVINPIINPGQNIQAKGISDSQVTVTWEDNSTHEDGFAIYRKINANNDFIKVGTVAAGVKVYTDSGLSSNTTYYYVVRSFRGSKESTTSKVANAQTLPEGTSTSKTVLLFKLDSREYFVDSEKKWMDAPLTMYKGRMVIPIKYVTEPLYGNSSWDQGKKQLSVSLGGNTVVCWVGNNKAMVNGMMKTIDAKDASVTPMIINGRLMLPARFVGENLGCSVSYNGVTKEMRITGP